MALSKLYKYFYSEVASPLRVCQLQWYNFGASTHPMTSQEANMHAGYADLVADNAGTSYSGFITAMLAVNSNLLVIDYGLLGETTSKGPLSDSDHAIDCYLVGQRISIASITRSGLTCTVTLVSAIQGAWAIGNNPYIQITDCPVAAYNGGWAVASITSTTVFTFTLA